jgi:hypothetical protein
LSDFSPFSAAAAGAASAPVKNIATIAKLRAVVVEVFISLLLLFFGKPAYPGSKSDDSEL